MFAQMCGPGCANSLGRACGAGKFLLHQGLGDSVPPPSPDCPYLLGGLTPGSPGPGRPSLPSPPSCFPVARGLAYQTREMSTPPAPPTISLHFYPRGSLSPILKNPSNAVEIKVTLNILIF